MKYLDYDGFIRKASDLGTSYWKKELDKRWEYHKTAVDMIKPWVQGPVLEIGTCCMPLTDSSVQMDLEESYFPDRNWPRGYPDVVHDINNIPWPFETSSFSMAVALQVFEHVTSPSVMKEALRVADYVLLSLPFEWKKSRYKDHLGIDMDTVIERYGRPYRHWFTGKGNIKRIIALWKYER